MASKVRGTILLAALAFALLANCAGAARPQLAWHASGAEKIGVEADAKSIIKPLQQCGHQQDEICNLPGLNGLPHVRMRAGYITVSAVSDRQLWYLVADREREDGADGPNSADSATVYDKPESGSNARDPVILWLTGGPGCSSLDAFIYEHGPFKFSYTPLSSTSSRAGSVGSAVGLGEAEGEQPTEAEAEAEEAAAPGGGGGPVRELLQGGPQRSVLLEPNPYSWTKVATVIYVDSPAGVGMSYSGRPDVDYHTNDEYTIADLVAFLEGLTERYPELAKVPFYLAGESYGGVFVPMLASELVRVNRKRRDAGRRPLVDLQGYSVGNPVTDDVIDGNAQMFFAADMGYVDPPSWRHMRDACDDMFWNATQGSECWDAQSVVKDDLWDLNWYDVLDPCTKPDDGDDDVFAGKKPEVAKSGKGSRRQRSASELERRFYWPFTARMGDPPSSSSGFSTTSASKGGLGVQVASGDEQQMETGRRREGAGGRRLWGPWLRHVVPCMDRRIALDWLNRADVRAALRAAPLSVIEDWQPCSDVLYYTLDTMDLVPVHEDLVRQGLRGLVYSGDHDMVVPHTGTRTWLYDKAKLGSTDGPLRPWTLHGQIAGFTARFSAGAGLQFVTVKGAGHMVPQSKPAVALHLLRTFLYNEEL